jgi:hypothetical protein
LRESTGRPHWLVLDEAHEVVPASRQGPPPELPGTAPNSIFVTMYPEALDSEALKSVTTILAFGNTPGKFLAPFADITGVALPPALPTPHHGALLYWRPKSADIPMVVIPLVPRQHHRRHVGKYATGDVGQERSFYFSGGYNTLNLPARNLYDFIEIADTVDDPIWDHHLHAGDYSAWFRHVIRDEGLARDAHAIEEDRNLGPCESRRMIKKAIWRRYAAPCKRVFGAQL